MTDKHDTTVPAYHGCQLGEVNVAAGVEEAGQLSPGRPILQLAPAQTTCKTLGWKSEWEAREASAWSREASSGEERGRPGPAVPWLGAQTRVSRGRAVTQVASKQTNSFVSHLNLVSISGHHVIGNFTCSIEHLQQNLQQPLEVWG